jgi:ubiquinone biosynthesis protein
MNEQMGWQRLLERLRNEAPRYAKLLPELPRLVHEALQHQVRTPTRDPRELLPSCCRAAAHQPAAAGAGCTRAWGLRWWALVLQRHRAQAHRFSGVSGLDSARASVPARATRCR